ARRRLARARLDLELEPLLLETRLRLDASLALALLEADRGLVAPRVLGVEPRALGALDLQPLLLLFLADPTLLGDDAGALVLLALSDGLLLRLDAIVLDLAQLAQREEHRIFTLICHTRGSSSEHHSQGRLPEQRSSRKWFFIPMGYVDLHSHVLPALDDGAPDPSTGYAMLRTLAAVGYDVVAATPHQKSGQFLPDLDAARAAHREMSARLADAGLPIRLSLGAENFWDEVFYARWRSGEIPSY